MYIQCMCCGDENAEYKQHLQLSMLCKQSRSRRLCSGMVMPIRRKGSHVSPRKRPRVYEIKWVSIEMISEVIEIPTQDFPESFLSVEITRKVRLGDLRYNEVTIAILTIRFITIFRSDFPCFDCLYNDTWKHFFWGDLGWIWMLMFLLVM